jgi:hypothetical protein
LYIEQALTVVATVSQTTVTKTHRVHGLSSASFARLTAQHTLNKQTIEARVKGKISDEDFATMKAA